MIFINEREIYVDIRSTGKREEEKLQCIDRTQFDKHTQKMSQKFPTCWFIGAEVKRSVID